VYLCGEGGGCGGDGGGGGGSITTPTYTPPTIAPDRAVLVASLIFRLPSFFKANEKPPW
jgi:hypothetical protein